jgi:galactokinase
MGHHTHYPQHKTVKMRIHPPPRILLLLLITLLPTMTAALNLQSIKQKHGAPMATKVEQASTLFQRHFPNQEATTIAVAPGRVNLIGEHTDYTGGYVLPFAIDYSCVVYGCGKLQITKDNSKKVLVQCVSGSSQAASEQVTQFDISPETKPPETPTWTTYVCGTIFQYLPDLPDSCQLDLQFAIASDVPLGSGLSSSASLEVSVARFVEAMIGEYAFSSLINSNNNKEGGGGEEDVSKVRALRCQKAENDFCQSPCGIMDQYISSAASSGSLLLIDCTSLESTETKMHQGNNMPVLVVTNSNVKHNIGGGEYPIRVAQCKTATEALQKVNPKITTLRYATLKDVEHAKDLMDPVTYKRAKHVVTENARVLEAKLALEQGDWKTVGTLMNGSHTSMRDDYEVSCEEIDILVEIAQNFPGVYGSRLTGGGFGGCTVTLVEKDAASSLIDKLQEEFKAKTGTDCDCFQTQPAKGTHILDF